MPTQFRNYLPITCLKFLRRVEYFYHQIKINGFRKLILRHLYKKYVNEPFIPSKSEVFVQRYPMTHGKNWGKIDSVKIIYNHKEECLFNFTHKITESDNGIIYLAKRAKDLKIDILYELQERERGQSSS